MKNFVFVSVALFVFVSISQGSVVITATASVGPSPESSSYGILGGYSGQVLSSLSTSTSPGIYPVSAPQVYSLAPTELYWGDLTVDNSGQSVWGGEIITDSSSLFYSEKGTAFYVNLKIVGDGVHKFSADDISYVVTSTDSAHSLSSFGSLIELTYGVDSIIGIDFGVDGIRSPDDVVYGRFNPASGSTPVDMILYVGVAVAFDATTVGLGYVQNYVNSVGPFDLTISYSINDGTGVYESSQTRTVVPEPATLCMLGIGAITLIRRRK